MQTVTKKDVAKRTAKMLDEKIYTTEKFVDAIFTVLREILAEANPEVRIEIRDFGVFETKIRASRVAQNPKTLDRVEVPAKRTVKFKMGRLMRENLHSPKVKSTEIA